MTTSDNPVELFDMYVAHIGINADSPEEAERITDEIEAMTALPKNVVAPISFFAGSLFEVMSVPSPGTKGHVGLHVNDIDAAVKWFADRGYEIDENSWGGTPDGSIRVVYLKHEIAGFAIHLTTQK